MTTGTTLKTKTWAPKRRFESASVAALLAAGLTMLSLPSSVFQASAIVAIDEPSAALRLAAARSAANLAVSKPVIMRAAASLNGTVVSAPAPAFVQKIAVATGLIGATGAVARLAETLISTASARPGDGLVEIQAHAPDAARAARVATALAESLIAEEDNAVAESAHRRESSAGERLEALRENARAAHARLAELGVSETDPAEALAAAAAATRAAEARASSIHSVIAAGTPPLGAGRELPPGAATLQQTYWDLKKQLDKASETMGERHTTVIALRDGVSRAAANLTLEWQRIERVAASDLSLARSREAVLRKAASAVDPAKRAVADEARSAARFADAAVSRAIAPATTPFAAPTFRLVAPAAVPTTASGLDAWQRVTIAGGAGAAAFMLVLLAMGRRRPRRMPAAARASEAAEGRHIEIFRAMPDNATADIARDIEAPARNEIHEPLVASVEAGREAGDHERVDRAPFSGEAADFGERHPDVIEDVRGQLEDVPVNFGHDLGEDVLGEDDLGNASFESDWLGFELDTTDDDRIAAMPFESASYDAERDDSDAPSLATPRSATPNAWGINRELRDALRAIAADLPMPGPGAAMPTSVMVAANATGADTGAVALALGEAAAELGYRVLVIEAERARPTLAEAVAPRGDPILVDSFGALRVALPAERGDGLFLAPAFRDGARIAAALARNTQADLIDDLAAAFDAIVIDGGRAADCAAAGWSAEGLIRVGRFASQKDDAYFLEALNAPSEALLGTVAAGRFVARQEPPEPKSTLRPVMRPVSEPVRHTSPHRPTSAPALRVPPRRRINAR